MLLASFFLFLPKSLSLSSSFSPIGDILLPKIHRTVRTVILMIFGRERSEKRSQSFLVVEKAHGREMCKKERKRWSGTRRSPYAWCKTPFCTLLRILYQVPQPCPCFLRATCAFDISYAPKRKFPRTSNPDWWLKRSFNTQGATSTTDTDQPYKLSMGNETDANDFSSFMRRMKSHLDH